MGESRVYHRVLDRTKEMVQNNDRLKKLLVGVGEKLVKVGDESGESKNFLKLLKMLVRMVTSHITGEYRAFSPMTLLMMAFCLVYFVMPLDLIPDFVPALGFTDDLAVTVMIMQRFKDDINSYREWEQSQLSQ